MQFHLVWELTHNGYDNVGACIAFDRRGSVQNFSKKVWIVYSPYNMSFYSGFEIMPGGIFSHTVQGVVVELEHFVQQVWTDVERPSFRDFGQVVRLCLQYAHPFFFGFGNCDSCLVSVGWTTGS